MQSCARQRLVAGRQSRQHPQGQQAIHVDQRGPVHKTRGKAQDQAGPQTGLASNPAPGPDYSQTHHQECRQARNQPGGPIVNAKKAVAAHDQPIKHGRFLQVGSVVQNGREELPFGQHFPRDLGITRFFRLQKRTGQAAE